MNKYIICFFIFSFFITSNTIAESLNNKKVEIFKAKSFNRKNDILEVSAYSIHGEHIICSYFWKKENYKEQPKASFEIDNKKYKIIAKVETHQILSLNSYYLETSDVKYDAWITKDDRGSYYCLLVSI